MSEECRDTKIMQPEIHLGKCEGAGDCADVCPYHVFEIRKATELERTDQIICARPQKGFCDQARPMPLMRVLR